MKCPFMIFKNVDVNLFDNHSKGDVRISEYFRECYGDSCPFFYKNDEDVDHCARCDGGPREEEL